MTEPTNAWCFLPANGLLRLQGVEHAVADGMTVPAIPGKKIAVCVRAMSALVKAPGIFACLCSASQGSERVERPEVDEQGNPKGPVLKTDLLRFDAVLEATDVLHLFASTIAKGVVDFTEDSSRLLAWVVTKESWTRLVQKDRQRIAMPQQDGPYEGERIASPIDEAVDKAITQCQQFEGVIMDKRSKVDFDNKQEDLRLSVTLGACKAVYASLNRDPVDAALTTNKAVAIATARHAVLKWVKGKDLEQEKVREESNEVAGKAYEETLRVNNQTLERMLLQAIMAGKR